MFRSLSALALLLLLALPGVAMAQNTGKLAGTVTDDSGETLPGATVFLPEIQRGAATDIDGTYTILGVPVGTYEVQFSSVGYGSQSIEDVTISRDRTRQLDVTLSSGQELNEVTVSYERPIIANDASVARVVSGEDIENLPVRGPSTVASLTAGVVSESGSSDLYVRGGRSEEVTYFVDGVKIVGGSGNVGVPTQAIAEQEILVGTIPPQYGDVLSGVISISTLSGGNNFFGSLEANTSEGLDGFGSSLAALTLGGPLIKDRASFLLSGSYEFQGDNAPYGISTLRLRDDVYNDLQLAPQALQVSDQATGEVSYIPIQDGQLNGVPATEEGLRAALGAQLDGFDISSVNLLSRADLFSDASSFEERRAKDNTDRDIVLNGNLTFRPGNGASIRFGGTYTDSENETFSYSRSWFNRDATRTLEDRSYRFYGTARQAVGATTFLQLQGEYTNRDQERYPTIWGSGVENTLNYGDVDSELNATAARYLSVDSDGNYAASFADGSIGVGSRYALFNGVGDIQTQYNRFTDSQVRVFGSATTQIGPHQLDIGGEYEKRTSRGYSLIGTGLARYSNDGDVATGLTPVDSYGQRGEDGEYLLPSSFFLTNARWYGYDYLGLETAGESDQDNLAFAERTNLDVAPYEPIYYGAYLRDKIEFSDLVLDIGFRVDAFDNNTTILADPFALQDIYRVRDFNGGNITTSTGGMINFPADGVPSTIGQDFALYTNATGNVVGYRDIEGQYYDDQGRQVDFDDVTSIGTAVGEQEVSDDVFDTYETQFTFMPRVGVSFPVTNRALFFASYNVTSQRPSENAFATIQDYITSNSGQSRINNANLKPERTTQYELGLRQRVGERAAVTLSGFYRTQQDKIQLRTVRGAFPSTYTTYDNVDFTTVKGAELGFELRRTNNVAVNANYTLSFAEGTGSESTTTTIIAWRGNTFPETITPLEFDSRHSLTASLDYRLAEGEGPMIGGVQPFGGFGVNLLGQFRSGGPYTPLATARNINDNFGGIADGVSINGNQRPSIATLDFRVDRKFNLGPAALRAYVNVTNLLDAENVAGVYRATGEVDNDGFLATQAGQDVATNFGDQRDAFIFAYQNYTASPVSQSGFQVGGLGGAGARLYGLPRQVRLGVIMDF